MRVIGAGFGRTGTMSMQAAFDTLGYRCYHMREVAKDPKHLKAWDDFIRGKAPMDWQTLFRNYEATVDFPACVYYRELLEMFPDAKVVLNVRDADRWYDSFCTLRGAMDGFRVFRFIPKVRRFLGFTDTLIDQVFSGSFERENCVRVFNDHNLAVQQHVPAERLLVFSVKDGWAPLCGFLGCEVPDGVPFPHLNEGGETLKKFGNQMIVGPWIRRATLAAAVVALVMVWWWLVR